MSGSPSPRRASPGNDEGDDEGRVDLGMVLDDLVRRPSGAKTEYASTAGMIAATSTTHSSCSNSQRNAQPEAVRAELREVRGEVEARLLHHEGDEREDAQPPRAPSATTTAEVRGRRARVCAASPPRRRRPRPARARPRRDEARRRTTSRPQRRGRRTPRRGSVRRCLAPPLAEHLEGVPERRLRRLLVERLVDVGRDERLDRRRELLQLPRSSARARARAGSERR